MLATGTSIKPLALLLVLCVGTGAWDAMRSPANPAQATFAIAATEIARSRDEFSGVSLSKVAPGTQERLAAQEDGALGGAPQMSAWIPAAWRDGLAADLQDATIAIRNLGNDTGLADGNLPSALTTVRTRQRQGR
jgi:hypothetical protein